MKFDNDRLVAAAREYALFVGLDPDKMVEHSGKAYWEEMVEPVKRIIAAYGAPPSVDALCERVVGRIKSELIYCASAAQAVDILREECAKEQITMGADGTKPHIKSASDALGRESLAGDTSDAACAQPAPAITEFEGKVKDFMDCIQICQSSAGLVLISKVNIPIDLLPKYEAVKALIAEAEKRRGK